MHPGILYAALAYTAWGLFPLYFRQVADVPSLEVVMHRTWWSLVFVLAALLVRRQWAWMGPVLRQPRVLGAFVLSALLLSGNWLTYVWAVQNQHVVDASLGYFILPLVNVALGFVFLRERPRAGQWMAVAVAAAGVLWLTVQAGRLPWIALVLALSFGFYGLLRKVAVLGALEGLALETMMLAPLAAAVLGYWAWQGQGPWCRGPQLPWGGYCWRVRLPPCRCCCLPRVRAASPCPPWASCSTSRPACSSRWACGYSTKPSSPRAWWVSC